MGTRRDYSRKFFSFLQAEEEIRPIRLPRSLDIDTTPDFYQDELFQTCLGKEDSHESGPVFDLSIEDDSNLGTLKSFGQSESMNSPGDLSKDVQIDVKLVPLAENSPRFPVEVPSTLGKIKIPSAFKNCLGGLEDRIEADSYLKGTKTQYISDTRPTQSRIIQFSLDKMERKEEEDGRGERLLMKERTVLRNRKLPGLIAKSDIRESRLSDQFSSCGSINFISPTSKYQLTGQFSQRSPSSGISSPGKMQGKTVEMRAKEPRKIFITSESERSLNTDQMLSINLSRGNSIQDHENASNSQNSQHRLEGGLNGLFSKRKVGSNRSGGSSRSSSASITLKEHRRKLQIDKPASKFRSLSPEKVIRIDENPLIEKSIESSESEELRNKPKIGGKGLVRFQTNSEAIKTDHSQEENSKSVSPSKTVTIVKKLNLNLRVPSKPKDEIQPKPAEIPFNPFAANIKQNFDIITSETLKVAKKPLISKNNTERDSLGEIPEVTNSSMSIDYTGERRHIPRFSFRSDILSSRYEESPRDSTKRKRKLKQSLSEYQSHIDENKKSVNSKSKQHKHRSSNFGQEELLKEPPSARGDIQVSLMMIDKAKQLSDGICDTDSEELRESEQAYDILPRVEEEKTPKANKKKRKDKKHLEEVNILTPSTESPLKSKRESMKHKNKRKKHAEKVDTTNKFQETYDGEVGQIHLVNVISDSNLIPEPPARSIAELFNRLNEIQIPKKNIPHKSNITRNRSFLQRLFGCCLVEKFRSKNPQAEFISLINFCYTQTFDDSNSLHLFLLSTIYTQLSSPTNFIPRFSEDWSQLGFSTQDPASDLLSSSLLSLINLTFFSLSLPTQLKFILQASKSEDSRFELLSTSFSISSHAYTTFKSGALNSLIRSSDAWSIQNLYYTGVFLWWFNLNMTKNKMYTTHALFLKTFEHASKHPQEMISLCQFKMKSADNK